MPAAQRPSGPLDHEPRNRAKDRGPSIADLRGKIVAQKFFKGQEDWIRACKSVAAGEDGRRSIRSRHGCSRSAIDFTRSFSIATRSCAPPVQERYCPSNENADVDAEFAAQGLEWAHPESVSHALRRPSRNRSRSATRANGRTRRSSLGVTPGIRYSN